MSLTFRLYWNERGAIACEKHTPYVGSDSWVWERWERMTSNEWEAWEAEQHEPPKCEVCGSPGGGD